MLVTMVETVQCARNLHEDGPQRVEALALTCGKPILGKELPNGEGGGPWQAHSSWSWGGLLEACRREGMPQGSVAGPSDSCRHGAWGAGLPQVRPLRRP